MCNISFGCPPNKSRSHDEKQEPEPETKRFMSWMLVACNMTIWKKEQNLYLMLSKILRKCRLPYKCRLPCITTLSYDFQPLCPKGRETGNGADWPGWLKTLVGFVSPSASSNRSIPCSFCITQSPALLDSFPIPRNIEHKILMAFLCQSSADKGITEVVFQALFLRLRNTITIFLHLYLALTGSWIEG